ncbi:MULTISPECIES: hypothetical protein [Paenibacillus]|uniref:hypothetical protein n=1 Tax=Paenibacillus TaxID=44249 RepID=UPI000361805C|nr:MULTISPECIES: hypothetical protein [Paenibacillus]
MEIREFLDQRLTELNEEQKTAFIKEVCLILYNRNNSDLIVRAKVNELVQRYELAQQQ